MTTPTIYSRLPPLSKKVFKNLRDLSRYEYGQDGDIGFRLSRPGSGGTYVCLFTKDYNIPRIINFGTANSNLDFTVHPTTGRLLARDDATKDFFGVDSWPKGGLTPHQVFNLWPRTRMRVTRTLFAQAFGLNTAKEACWFH